MKNNHYVLAIKFINEKTINKILFNIDDFIINNITDHLLDNNTIKRVNLNTISTIENNVIIHIAKKLSLIPLRTSKIKKKDFVVDRIIGSIYTETFLDYDSIQKIYALGYRINLENKPVTFYIDKDTKDSDKFIIDLIETLLRSKYDEYTIYCHNLRGYDVVFILKALVKYNEINNNYYKINTIFIDSIILELIISKLGDKSQNRVVIRDSFAMLNSSLENLAYNFDVDTKKSIFPHEFAKRNTLFYKGDTPDIKYYVNLSNKAYNNLKVDN